jgi:hypothetical protein
MQVTAISDLQDGKYIKIEGRVSSNLSTPIYGFHNEDRSNSLEWKFQTLPIMNVTDSTGTIEVDLKNYSRIYKGPSESVDSSNRTVSEYKDGDPVSVIGTVETMNNGTLRVRAEFIAKDSRSFGESTPEFLLILECFMIFGVILAGIGLWINHRRVSQYHLSGQEEKASENWPVVAGESSIHSNLAGDIEWMNNDQRTTFLRKRKIINTICISVLVLGMIFLLPALFSGQICICITSLIVLISPIITVWIFTVWEPIVPLRVGFSSAGLHVDYPKAPTISTQFNFIKWSDILGVSYALTPLKAKEDWLTKGYRLKFNVRPAGKVVLFEINEELAAEVIRRFYLNRQDVTRDEKLDKIKEMVKRPKVPF